jgi:FkbM family methyltransferase
MIPRILHRVVRSDPDPTEEKYWSAFSRLHPDWDLRTWRQPHDTTQFPTVGHLLERCSSGAQQADLVRLELLLKYGGVYVDADCEPVRSLDPLLTYGCFLGTEDGYHISTGVIGATPNHPALQSYLDALIAEDRLSLDAPANETTGPFLATAILRERSDVTVLPPEFFYPLRHGERPTSDAAYVTPYTYCVHHWAASWAGPSPLRRGLHLRRRARRVAIRAARTAAGAWDRALPDRPTVSAKGTWVGNGRVVVDLPGDLRIAALADDLSITPELVTKGMYDWPFWRFLHATIKPGDHVVDVGANIGLFTLALASLVGPFGRVYAYEPSGELAGVLEDNLAMNWMRDRVELLRVAASDHGGELPFRSDARFRLLGVAGPSDAGAMGCAVVPAERIDARIHAGVPLRLVKVDVEGGEYRVLRGLRGLLDRAAIRFLDVEVIRENAGVSWPVLAAELRELRDVYGARCSVLTTGGSLQPSSLDRLIATAGHHAHVVFEFPSAPAN